MMSRLLVLVSLATLAACGGGGGSSAGGGGTPPTSTPISYAAKLVYQGGLVGPNTKGVYRAPMNVRHPSDTGTPVPIMVVSPITSDGMAGAGSADSYGGVVEAIASPAPGVTPTVVFANTNSAAALHPTPTPQPSQTNAPGLVGAQVVNSNGTVNAQSSGTVTATIGSPVNATPSTAIYAYRAIALRCLAPFSGGQTAGWIYNGTAFVPDADLTTADIYMTSQQCGTSSEAIPTVHVPGGATAISSNTAFCSVTAAQWANSFTAIDVSTLIHLNPDGSVTALLIGKTRDGAHTFKVFPNSIGNTGTGGEFDGAISVFGAGPDGT